MTHKEYEELKRNYHLGTKFLIVIIIFVIILIPIFIELTNK